MSAGKGGRGPRAAEEKEEEDQRKEGRRRRSRRRRRRTGPGRSTGMLRELIMGGSCSTRASGSCFFCVGVVVFVGIGYY